MAVLSVTTASPWLSLYTVAVVGVAVALGAAGTHCQKGYRVTGRAPRAPVPRPLDPTGPLLITVPGGTMAAGSQGPAGPLKVGGVPKVPGVPRERTQPGPRVPAIPSPPVT